MQFPEVHDSQKLKYACARNRVSRKLGNVKTRIRVNHKSTFRENAHNSPLPSSLLSPARQLEQAAVSSFLPADTQPPNRWQALITRLDSTRSGTEVWCLLRYFVAIPPPSLLRPLHVFEHSWNGPSSTMLLSSSTITAFFSIFSFLVGRCARGDNSS